MYADDTTLLFRSSDQVSLQIDLDSNLNRIAQWFNRNKLTLNIKKTKLMLFGTKKNLDKFKNVSLKYNNIASGLHQGCSQTLNLRWARQEHYLIFSHSSIIFSHSSSIFPIFFLNLVLRMEPGRHWLRHWLSCNCVTSPKDQLLDEGQRYQSQR